MSWRSGDGGDAFWTTLEPPRRFTQRVCVEPAEADVSKKGRPSREERALRGTSELSCLEV